MDVEGDEHQWIVSINCLGVVDAIEDRSNHVIDSLKTTTEDGRWKEVTGTVNDYMRRICSLTLVGIDGEKRSYPSYDRAVSKDLGVPCLSFWHSIILSFGGYSAFFAEQRMLFVDVKLLSVEYSHDRKGLSPKFSVDRERLKVF
ncbi:hypothetical protein C5167_015774 [Papaver somniferum]|uniref:Uncharacterized protein n=1 Tax=Papaver somniferum TaxID=3469 RepID=A0A4Y7JBB6_PAPSO|nr:hypothetical protein C5167_015774 [Papaver somniferum]